MLGASIPNLTIYVHRILTYVFNECYLELEGGLREAFWGIERERSKTFFLKFQATGILSLISCVVRGEQHT